jgi:hypothetical protein
LAKMGLSSSKNGCRITKVWKMAYLLVTFSGNGSRWTEIQLILKFSKLQSHWIEKKKFWQNSKSWFVYFTETENHHQMSRIWKKVASSFCKVLANLTGWKTEYLIAQLRAGIWRKVFRLKTCPQGKLQAQ